MLVENAALPVMVFNVDDFGLDKNQFLVETTKVFEDLPWDYYDMRKLQLDFLQKANTAETWRATPLNLVVAYYLGEVELLSLQNLLKGLSPEQLSTFHKIKAYRRRSIAEFMLTSNSDDWKVKRIAAKQFSQLDAKIDGFAEQVDYRKYPRVFSESSGQAVDSPTFQKLIKGVANIFTVNFPKVKALNIVTHHTYVEATDEQIGDNSPEGIHQDGYDYIVSALVIERENISGGISQVFGADKKTRILASRLMPGQGILQPDRGTTLWHNVTPFAVNPGCRKGYRSSIGFDINIQH